MRLTLRTMLAYMDDVLEPADAEVLGKKIEESDFASGLMDRIQGVMKKLRMDAPKVDGKGMGSDANTVAEYLDSSLPQDRVGEFERVCLESDKHLCEVAACHQILTLVLGKPADVPTELRDRVYALGSPERTTASAAPTPPPATVPAPAPVPPPVAKDNGQPARARPRLEVPEYLRSGRPMALWPVVLGTAALILLGILGLRALGPFNDDHPLAKLLRRPPAVAQAPADNAAASTAPGQPTATSGAAPAAVAAAPEPETSSGETPETKTDIAIAAAGAASTVPEAPGPASESPASPPGNQVAIAAAAPAATGADLSPSATPPLAEPPATTEPLIKPGPPVEAPARLQPMEVGRYTSDGQLLATFNAADGLWYAKEPQAILVAEERMVVLPPYRPQISLPSAVTLTFAGEGALRLNEPAGNPNPSVTVEYGRFLAATAGRPGAEVELHLAGIKGVLTLLDADSVMAIKVLRWVPPGVDPQEFAGIAIIEMYNTSGRAAWQPAEQPKTEIPPRHVHVYYGTDPPETHGPFLPPEWTDSRNVKPIDRITADALEPMIAPERPITVSLQEALKDRRVDVRALASRCLAVLEDFEPALTQLADPNQHSYWSAQFDALRQALARSPETAAKVHETITLLRPAHAKEIYRLLCGFSEDQVEKGAGADLVRFLEHEQMDVRVLAHLNLVNITGAWGFYRPERSPAQNKSAIQNWRDRQTKGTIIYRLPPSPLDTYRPAPAAGAGDAKSGASSAPNPITR